MNSLHFFKFLVNNYMEGRNITVPLEAMADCDLSKALNCSICLNIYNEAVMLGCGHNFCRSCIDCLLDTQKGSGAYTCPECREEFQERPELVKNITLCNILEHYLSSMTELEETIIFCTYCIHSPVPAVKSCLMCEASFCENHLRVHNKSEEHVLTEPSNSLRRKKCPVHRKVLEYFCTEDAVCICVSCYLAGVHRGHKVELLNEASKKKKEKVTNIFENLLSTKMETEKRVQSLQERKREVREKAAGERERITVLLTDIRTQLDDLEKKVLCEISEQEEQISLSISDLIHQLEMKRDALSRKMRHIEELCDMPDAVTVLQEQETEREDFFDTEGYNRDIQTYDMQVHVGDLKKDLISVTLHTGLVDIVSSVQINVNVQKNADIIFDVNTACGYVIVADDFKSILWKRQKSIYPETPQMFETFPQVLSTRRLNSGRHFLEWRMNFIDDGSYSVGMCYPSIERKGDQSCIGFNKKSWCLRRYKGQYSVIHNSDIIYLPQKPACERFRMYLDYEAGQLSFYELCEPMRHLYTFTATFTESLHDAFYIFGEYISIKITNSNKVQSSAQ